MTLTYRKGRDRPIVHGLFVEDEPADEPMGSWWRETTEVGVDQEEVNELQKRGIVRGDRLLASPIANPFGGGEAGRKR